MQTKRLKMSDITTQSSSMCRFQVSAPGKVILLGEHSVVYGKTALAASLDQRTSLVFSSCNNGNNIRLSLPMLGVTQEFSLKEVRELVARPLPVSEQKEYNWRRPDLIKADVMILEIHEFINKLEGHPFNHGMECALTAFLFLLRGMFAAVRVNISSFAMEVMTDLKIGAGTGSSASYGVCLAAALYNFLRLRAKEENVTSSISKDGFNHSEIVSEDLSSFIEEEVGIILSWALVSDGIMHGNPSGIDATVITYGRMIEFRKGEGGAKIARVPPMNIMLVNTQVSRDTKRLVSYVAQRREKLPNVIDPILEAMDQVALAAKWLFSESELKNDETDSSFISSLGELMTINHSLLSALGVSHPSLDNICSIAQRHGFAAKLTGAGGGGYAIVLLPSDAGNKSIQSLKNEMTSAGYDPVLAVMGGDGVQLHDLTTAR